MMSGWGLQSRYELSNGGYLEEPVTTWLSLCTVRDHSVNPSMGRRDRESHWRLLTHSFIHPLTHPPISLSHPTQRLTHSVTLCQLIIYFTTQSPTHSHRFHSPLCTSGRCSPDTGEWKQNYVPANGMYVVCVCVLCIADGYQLIYVQKQVLGLGASHDSLIAVQFTWQWKCGRVNTETLQYPLHKQNAQVSPESVRVWYSTQHMRSAI